MAKSAKRPGIVTVLGVLGIISGVAKLFTGLMIALASDKSNLMRETSLSSEGVVWAGVAFMALGAITLYVAVSIMSGARWAQVLYGVIAAINMVAGLWSIFAHDGISVWSGALTLIINFIILQLLFNERSQAYFED